jgi:S-formylglutathione hydrolase FrmB
MRIVRARVSLFLAVLLCTCGLSAQAPNPLRFRIQLALGMAQKPVDGRLLVFMAPFEPSLEEIVPENGAKAHSVWIAAREVRNLAPGGSVEMNPDELAYPAPFSTRAVGGYQIMALLDVNHDYAYNGASAGDLRSPVLSLGGVDPARTGVIDLPLSLRVPEPKLELPPDTELLDFVSPTLSEFWGRPIHMRGVIVLPPSYGKDPDRKYPAVYWTHGFGESLPEIAKVSAKRYRQQMLDGKLPEMIYVLLDQSCSGGTHEFADSVNNGPWGMALTGDLIPYLEAQYRMDGKPSGRLLTGHSSGGWAALWLQVSYPMVFGGSWPTAPDPSDFRNFTGPNLRADPLPNFYRKADHTPWPLMRETGKDTQTLEDYARQERVLGEQGGQLTSFEWAFSPRGDDGHPQPLFDRNTGVIDPAVASAWQHYDIAQLLRNNPDGLRALLDGKIHLIVGAQDTFHLNESAQLLQETARELKINITFDFVPGRDHMNLYEGGLDEQIGREMNAVARPKASAAAQ